MTVTNPVVLRPQDAKLALLNADPLFLAKWRLALTKVLQNTNDATIACIGDSTTVGNGSSPNTWDQSFPAFLAVELNKRINARADSQWGGKGKSAVDFGTYETRATLGAGWAFIPLSVGFGGTRWRNSTTTNAFAFTPTGIFDSADFYTLQFSGLGTGTVDIDGVGTVSINSNGSSAMIKTSIAKGSAGTTCNVKWVSGIFDLFGIICRRAATKQINVLNGGVVSSDTNFWTVSMPSYADSHNISPDLTIVWLGINDPFNGIAASTTFANLQTLVTLGQTTGDVLLMIPNQVDASVDTLAAQAAVIGAFKTAATQGSCWLLDVSARYGSYLTANAVGWMSGTVHPLQNFYRDLAIYVANLLFPSWA